MREFIQLKGATQDLHKYGSLSLESMVHCDWTVVSWQKQQ